MRVVMGDIHEAMAREALPGVNRVWCRTCGRSQEIDAADCLRNGWPKCCRYTMTIDRLRDEPAAPATLDGCGDGVGAP